MSYLRADPKFQSFRQLGWLGRATQGSEGSKGSKGSEGSRRSKANPCLVKQYWKPIHIHFGPSIQQTPPDEFSNWTALVDLSWQLRRHCLLRQASKIALLQSTLLLHLSLEALLERMALFYH